VRYTFLWYWLQPTPALSDFRRPIGANIQFFPFLLQRSVVLPREVKTYLAVGDHVNGVVYFEQPESWGGFKPRVYDNNVAVKIRLRDGFGRWHSGRALLRVTSLDEARNYCEDFGRTYEELHSK
jgi:hypothetical protein